MPSHRAGGKSRRCARLVLGPRRSAGDGGRPTKGKAVLFTALKGAPGLMCCPHRFFTVAPTRRETGPPLIPALPPREGGGGPKGRVGGKRNVHIVAADVRRLSF